MSHPLDRFQVCLVGTQNPENLGSVARVMMNFGFEHLSLVDPRTSPDHHLARVVARKAEEVLARARRVSTLEEAVVGATLVVGTTARKGTRRASVTPRALARRLNDLDTAGRVVLVFGPEDSGLTAQEADRCDLLCTIPTRGALSSLNLAQAVSVLLWEVSQLDARAPRSERQVASRGEIEGFLDHAFDVLARIGYLDHRDAEQVRTHLRRILVAAALRSEQVTALRGVCRQALWALRREEGGGAAPVDAPPEE